MPSYSFLLAGTSEQKQIALVRNEIDDLTDAEQPKPGADYFVSDERITAFLASSQDEAPDDANEVEVRLWACAAILDTLATNQAYQLKVGQTLGESRDGAKVADAIRAHAKTCRARAQTSLDDRRKLAAHQLALGQRPGAPSSGGFTMEVRL